MTDDSPSLTRIRGALLDAALPHVAFDGWSDATFRAAVAESGVDPALARAVCSRGGVDLALAYHARGDAAMVARLNAEDMGALRYSDRVAKAIRTRIEVISDKEAARRASSLFALPQHAADGTRAVWRTCDLIWRTLGDNSDDINWYTKRLTLSGVYGATLLYWLGDDSADHARTWAFLDRRIHDVMQIEKVKSQIRTSPVLKPFLALPGWALGKVRAPSAQRGAGLPGHMSEHLQE